MSSTKLLVLGLDSADKDLVRDWAADGSLPTFARLLETCRFGELNAPPGGQNAGTAWQSIITGLLPSGHGRYFISQLRPGSYQQARIMPHEHPVAPFWQHLSEAGKRVAIIDVPKMAPGTNGWQLVDWGTHDRPYQPPQSHPPSFLQEIEARFGRDPVGDCGSISRRATGSAGLEELRDRLVERIRIKRNIIQYVLDRGPWDIVMAVFADPHCAGHHFWRISDRSHPDHEPDIARLLGNPLRDVYVALDAALGELIAGTSPNTDLVVISDLGMGPNYTGTYLLRDIVRNLHAAGRGAKSPQVNPLRRAWRRLPRSVRMLGRSVASPVLPDVDLEAKNQDYFVLRSNDDCGAIRINLQGREPEGRIRAGREYDELCETISRSLHEIVNLESGEPIVQEIIRGDSLPDGPYRHLLPDLNIVWNRRAPIRRIHSKKIGIIERRQESPRTGDHRPTGFVLFRGIGIEAGRMPAISAMDFAPTICARLGVEFRADGSPALPALANPRH